MGQVVVTIAGRSFRLACDDGDEARLAALAESFDATVSQLRGSFGEIGDTRLAVMAGLLVTDKLQDAEAKAQRLKAQVSELQAALSLVQNSHVGQNDQVGKRLDTLSARLERLVGAARAEAKGDDEVRALPLTPRQP